MFTDILDFPTGLGPISVIAEGMDLGVFGSEESLSFLDSLGHYVSSFDVFLEPGPAFPDTPLPFALQLGFAPQAGPFTMVALEQSPGTVPEPSIAALLSLAAAAALTERRRRRK